MNKREIKGEWSFKGKKYFLVEDKNNFNAKEDETFFTPKELIEEIISHNRHLLLSIREGRIKKDSLYLLKSTRRNLELGEMIGTKEAIIKKFIKIKSSFENIRKMNYKILDNIYMSVVESSQALFLSNNIKITSPRNIPEKLNKLSKKLNKKLDIGAAKEIIKTFKDYEHSKIRLPSGKKLDLLISKAKKFNEEVKELL